MRDCQGGEVWFFFLDKPLGSYSGHSQLLD